jgi:hypothetical protein
VSQILLSAEFLSGGQAHRREVAIASAIVAGWTGRDPQAVEKHIRELEELGVARPASVPIYYRVAAARLTTAPSIEVSGTDSSGEVEFVLLQSSGRLWVGVGSDHTDRKVETYNVTASKQMCDKPVAPTFWAFDEVADHWDRLILRSQIVEKGEPLLYQEGAVTSMRTPLDLIKGYAGQDTLPDDTLMFCGTLAARGGIRPSSTFSFSLEDPVLKRSIAHTYDVLSLPVLG